MKVHDILNNIAAKADAAWAECAMLRPEPKASFDSTLAYLTEIRHAANTMADHGLVWLAADKGPQRIRVNVDCRVGALVIMAALRAQGWTCEISKKEKGK